MSERFYLYDDMVDTKTRFVSFTSENSRFDLAIIQSDRYYGKVIVLNILGEDMRLSVQTIYKKKVILSMPFK